MIFFNLGNMTNEQTTDMVTFFEKTLVEQAVSQHVQIDEDVVLKGPVVGYRLDRENECLLVEYENGETWQYSCIDCGPEGMLYTRLVADGKKKD